MSEQTNSLRLLVEGWKWLAKDLLISADRSEMDGAACAAKVLYMASEIRRDCASELSAETPKWERLEKAAELHLRKNNSETADDLRAALDGVKS